MRLPERFSLDLNDVETRLLRWGVIEWGGPARGTEEMAIAMGFASVQDISDQTSRLIWAIAEGEELSAADWLRVLLLTEIVFASNAIGSGLDWQYTSGLSDEESLAALRSVQGKLAGIGRLLGHAFGTRRPPRGSAEHIRRSGTPSRLAEGRSDDHA